MSRSRPRRGRRGLWLLAALAALALFFWDQQTRIQPEEYVIQAAGLPEAFDGLRIVQISDLHGGLPGDGDFRRLLAAVEAQKPDLIAVTGDLIDRAEQMERMGALARALAAIAPTYYVTGNHEWAVRRVPELKELLARAGVTVLSNEFVTLERDGARLVVAGIDDPNGPADQKTGLELLEEVRAAEGADVYTVLLAHRDKVYTYDAWGYDLTLCGHGHGGIFRVPVLDRGVLGTDRNLFPEIDGGLYRYTSGKCCVVSRGLGSNTTPIHAFRLFNRPHLPVVVLRSAEI